MRECPLCTFHISSSHKTIATDAYEDFGKIRVWVNFLLNLGAFIVYSWLICGYQTAKSNKKVAFPVRVSCNTAIIIWSLLIPSFFSYTFSVKACRITNVLEKNSSPCLTTRLKALATAKIKIIYLMARFVLGLSI